VITMKFGRNRPKSLGPRFKFRNYAMAALPPPPTSVDYSPDALAILHDILGNDTAGDCTCAGVFHAIGTMLGNSGQPAPFTAADAIGLYSRITGYIPGDASTDQGSDEQTVLNYVQQNGPLLDGSHKIVAWMEIDATNLTEVCQAIWLFESVYMCLELPDEYVNPFPSGDGFLWAVEGNPNPAQGHCIVAVGYDAGALDVDSWGMMGKMTVGAASYYCAKAQGGSMAVLLSRDILAYAQAKSPAGFDWSQLAADFDSLTP
jgi:hypothetical protein